MYSVMLAAMLTTTSATPEWGCYGCYGCHSCYGCSGYTYCHGCCGGCYGWGYNAFSYGCSCYGCSCSGCWGCCGGCCGGYVPVFSYSCSCSCSGWYSCCGGCYGCCGGTVIIAKPAAGGGGGGVSAAADQRTRALEAEVRALREQNERLKEMIERMGPGKPGGGKPGGGKPGGKPGESDDVSVPAPAHVVVKLPENARLWVDDKPCPLTSATRAFDTPALQRGEVYFYTIRAEVTRDGRPVSESKRVTLRAGEESVVEFGDMAGVLTVGR